MPETVTPSMDAIKAAIPAARLWIADSFPDAEVQDLTNAEVVTGITRHYAGGWPGFIRDGGDAEELAGEAEREARASAPPVPGITVNQDYTILGVLAGEAPGMWYVYARDGERFVTWRAEEHPDTRHLAYFHGDYFVNGTASQNQADALVSLALRSGMLGTVFAATMGGDQEIGVFTSEKRAEQACQVIEDHENRVWSRELAKLSWTAGRAASPDSTIYAVVPRTLDVAVRR